MAFLTEPMAATLAVAVIALVSLGTARLLIDSVSLVRKRVNTSFAVALFVTWAGLLLLFHFLVLWFFLGVLS